MKTILVVSADAEFRDGVVSWLSHRLDKAFQANDGRRGLEVAKGEHLDFILLDADSLNASEFCKEWCKNGLNRNASRVVLIGGSGVIDGVQLLEFGASEYLTKPLRYERLDQVLSHTGDTEMRRAARKPGAHGTYLKFWGVRGSTPSPGAETILFGGNTSCVEVRTGGEIIILDAGTGIRRLGSSLKDEFKDRPMNLNLLITHTHWDHIQGFPFFQPAYDPKNQLTIYGFEGARHGLEGTLSSQMESPYFPISMQQMPGHIHIKEVKQMHFTLGAVQVYAHFLDHPGICAGYKLVTKDGSIAYLPDVELFRRTRSNPSGDTDLVIPRSTSINSAEQDRQLVDFVRGVDVLILDAQYSAIEYEAHVGWGHSCVDDSVKFATEAQARRLFLFHHDPDHSDEQVSRMVAGARQLAIKLGSPVIIQAAQEGLELALPAKTRA